MLEEELSKLDKRIKIIRTDDILELEEKIGYAGFIDKALIDRNKDRIKTIIDRNRAFYVAKMGWSTEDSDTRSNNSITTYNILGQYFWEVRAMAGRSLPPLPCMETSWAFIIFRSLALHLTQYPVVTGTAPLSISAIFI